MNIHRGSTVPHGESVSPAFPSSLSTVAIRILGGTAGQNWDPGMERRDPNAGPVEFEKRGLR